MAQKEELSKALEEGIKKLAGNKDFEEKKEAIDKSEAELTENMKREYHVKFSEHALNFSQAVGNQWLEREKFETKTRTRLAYALIGILFCLLGTGSIVVVRQGNIANSFYLTDSAFVAFFSTFAVSFVSLVAIIYRYFYSERSNKSLEIIKEFIVDMCSHNRQYKDEDLDT